MKNKGAPFLSSKVWLFFLLLCVAAGGSLYLSFQHIKLRLLEEFDQLVHHQAQQGILLEYKNRTIRGWPWSPCLIVEKASLSGQRPLGWKILDITEIVVRYSPLQPGKLGVNIPHSFRIEWDLPQLPLAEIASLSGEISFSRPLEDCLVRFENITIGKLPEPCTTIAHFQLETAAVKAEPCSDKLQKGFQITLDHLKNAALPFSEIQHIKGQFASTGETSSGTVRESLGKWVKSGGSIEIQDLFFKADNLELSGAGTLSLDETLQPLVTFTSRVEGVAETINDMTIREVITPATARFLKLSLAFVLMAIQHRNFKMDLNEKAAPQTFDLSFTVQNGGLYIGSHKISSFPSIDWETLKFQL